LLAPNRRAKRTESDIALNEPKEDREQPVQPAPSWGWRKPVLGLLIALVVVAAIVGGAVGATARKKRTTQTGTDTGAQVGSGTLSSGIFGIPSTTSSSIPSTSSSSQVATSSSLADSVAVATNAPASSDIFPQAQVTARHFVTTRRR